MPFKFSIPKKLRFPLAWTIFFIIIGITIQSIKSGSFGFLKFFSKNYIDWFGGFGSFVSPTEYSSVRELLYSIISNWYYFFYTAGLISLLWNFIRIIISREQKQEESRIEIKK